MARTRDIDRVIDRLGTFEHRGRLYKVETLPDGCYRIMTLNKRGKVIQTAEATFLRTLVNMALDGDLSA